MSHYLKVLLDAIFGAENFLSEIIWKRSAAQLPDHLRPNSGSLDSSPTRG